MAPLLSVEAIDYRYGQVPALRDISMSMESVSVVSLLGMNGAGKTTLLSLISGLFRPSSGRILFMDRVISGMKPSSVVAAGVVQVPEGRQLFASFTVKENLEMGAYIRIRRRQTGDVAEDFERVLQLFPVLSERLQQHAGTLSGGEQQMLAMARGLMARPKLMLLDEPSLGLAPMITAGLFSVIRKLPESDCGVLLVEQNALGALAISSYAYVITNGHIRLSGTSKDILEDELLREAFLGPDRARLVRQEKEK